MSDSIERSYLNMPAGHIQRLTPLRKARESHDDDRKRAFDQWVKEESEREDRTDGGEDAREKTVGHGDREDEQAASKKRDPDDMERTGFFVDITV